MSLLSVAILLGAAPLLVSADTCYNRFGYGYYCSGGLSYGARIGIGLGIAAAAALLICGIMYWRRRQVRKQWGKFKPPALPFANNNNNNTTQQSSNPYANNPPPPQTQGSYNYGQQQSNYNYNPYGSNPTQPANVYQPSAAGYYGGNKGNNRDPVTDMQPGGNSSNEASHEHGYEWAQAREQERMEREQSKAEAPPGYDVSANPTGSTQYAPPPGPPPAGK